MSTKPFQDNLKLKNNRVTGSITVIGFESEGSFVFYSPALDLYGIGDDEAEAKEAFEETLHLYFAHIIEEETIDKDLLKMGWKKHKRIKSRFTPPHYDVRKVMSEKGVNRFEVLDEQLELCA
ncbi:MAG: hypothetical protein AAFY41_13365 [Bacteroidota bacterium]